GEALLGPTCKSHRIAPTVKYSPITSPRKIFGRFRVSSPGVVSASNNAYTQTTVDTNVIRPPSHSMITAYLAVGSGGRGADHLGGGPGQHPASGGAFAGFPEEEGPHLGFPEASVSSGGADTADPPRGGPAGDGLGINPEE